MPVMEAKHFLARRKAIYKLLKEVMVEGHDYMTLPGTEKPMLCKPGAEKVLQLFGMTGEPIPAEIIENWDDDEPFLYYKYEAVIRRGGRHIFTYTGLCHSKETRYRYRWVPEYAVPRSLDKTALEVRVGKASEYRFAIRKADTVGKWGKPAEYWREFDEAIKNGTARPFKKPMGQKQMDAVEIDLITFRIPNPEIPDLAHTLSMIAQKRAIVGATKWATVISDIFDVSEMVDEGDLIIEGEYSEVDAQRRVQEQEQERKAIKGRVKKADQKKAEKDTEELYGAPVKKNGKGKGKPVDVIRKAFGDAEGQDVPPEDDQLETMRLRLADLVDDADGWLETVFNKRATGMSEAHVTAIMAQDDDTIKAAV